MAPTRRRRRRRTSPTTGWSTPESCGNIPNESLMKHQVRRGEWGIRRRESASLASLPEPQGESWAISRHVLRKYKTAEVELLRESNLQESALVDVWLEVETHQYNPAISPIIYQHYLVPMRGRTPDQKLIGECVEKMKKVLGVYEARLSETKYLAGDFVSLADLSHFPYTVYFMRTPYASVFDSYPSVKAWWQELMSRPAVQRVVCQLPKE
ncbi:glutathione transferase [Panicum miliaceum]|uniref:glutathione transferase n=1 Tax=Panicum miliaceum TaxID=4540 RepID=A0A3L6R5D1_PANMI|nr:glutathione transferase [Panicum miliaceum]